MPFRYEHEAIIKDTDTEQVRVERTRGSGKNTLNGISVPTSVNVIWHIENRDGKDNPVIHSLRFPTTSWTAETAKEWLNKNDIKYTVFDAAKPRKKDPKNSEPFWKHYVDKTNKVLKLMIHEEIGFFGVESKQFVSLLQDHDSYDIELDLNTPGGVVWDGFSIYNNLLKHSGKVTVKITGLAASMGAVIATAGDYVEMSEASMIMWHKPLVSGFGNADEHRKLAETLDKIEKGIVAAYRRRVNKPDAEIEEILRNTTYYTAEEALDAGLVDSITEKTEIKDLFDLSQFEYGDIPEMVLNRFDVNHGPEELGIDMPDIEEPDFIDKLVNKMKQFFQPKIKERNTMAMTPEEKQEFDSLKLQVTNLKTAGEEKDKTIESLKKEVKDKDGVITSLKDQAKNIDKEARREEFRAFCQEAVNEFRIKASDVDRHIDTMEILYAADEAKFTEEKQETPLLDAYKDGIENTPPIVDSSGSHFADKGNVQPGSGAVDAEKKAVDAVIDEYRKAGKTIAYRDAIAEAHRRNPKLKETIN